MIVEKLKLIEGLTGGIARVIVVTATKTNAAEQKKATNELGHGLCFDPGIFILSLLVLSSVCGVCVFFFFFLFFFDTKKSKSLK